MLNYLFNDLTSWKLNPCANFLHRLFKLELSKGSEAFQCAAERLSYASFCSSLSWESHRYAQGVHTPCYHFKPYSAAFILWTVAVIIHAFDLTSRLNSSSVNPMYLSAVL